MDKQIMNITIVGHVDHGKSTIIGRMLADTDSLPKGKLQQVKEDCARNSKPFEYAFLLDALKKEQEQGITIDAARVFFNTKKRDYIILDAPGHIEFLKNMITGASRAEAALLVIDANEGIQENSKRHGYMLSMLGIKNIAVVINKMDLIDYDEKKYNKIVKDYRKFLKKISIEPETFIPVSGMLGDNIASNSEKIPWYEGETVLSMLDRFEKEPLPIKKPLRIPIQGVYKFTLFGDARRICAGTINTGQINVGDEIVFYPSGKSSKVKTIEEFNGKGTKTSAQAGESTGFTLEEQIYVDRGEIATRSDEEKTEVSSRFKVSLFWLRREALVPKKSYYLKIGTEKVEVKIEEIVKVLDASTLKSIKKNKIERHDVAECILRTKKPIAFDLSTKFSSTSRFVLINDFEIGGGGIITESLKDTQSEIRKNVMLRNYKWIKSDIHPNQRAERYNQKSNLILITGESGSGRKDIARSLEKRLFNEGKKVYYLGIGNVLYGVDADIKKKSKNNRSEHMRRLAEVSHIMLDAGIILIVTALELNDSDLDLIKTIVNPDKLTTIWIGDDITTNFKCDIQVGNTKNIDSEVNKIKSYLQDSKVIYNPW